MLKNWEVRLNLGKTGVTRPVEPVVSETKQHRKETWNQDEYPWNEHLAGANSSAPGIWKTQAKKRKVTILEWICLKKIITKPQIQMSRKQTKLETIMLNNYLHSPPKEPSKVSNTLPTPDLLCAYPCRNGILAALGKSQIPFFPWHCRAQPKLSTAFNRPIFASAKDFVGHPPTSSWSLWLLESRFRMPASRLSSVSGQLSEGPGSCPEITGGAKKKDVPSCSVCHTKLPSSIPMNLKVPQQRQGPTCQSRPKPSIPQTVSHTFAGREICCQVESLIGKVSRFILWNNWPCYILWYYYITNNFRSPILRSNLLHILKHSSKIYCTKTWKCKLCMLPFSPIYSPTCAVAHCSCPRRAAFHRAWHKSPPPGSTGRRPPGWPLKAPIASPQFSRLPPCSPASLWLLKPGQIIPDHPVWNLKYPKLCALDNPQTWPTSTNINSPTSPTNTKSFNRKPLVQRRWGYPRPSSSGPETSAQRLSVFTLQHWPSLPEVEAETPINELHRAAVDRFQQSIGLEWSRCFLDLKDQGDQGSKECPSNRANLEKPRVSSLWELVAVESLRHQGHAPNLHMVVGHILAAKTWLQ